MAHRSDTGGVDLDPDNPTGVPAGPAGAEEPTPQPMPADPMPGDAGVIAPGPTPGSR